MGKIFLIDYIKAPSALASVIRDLNADKSQSK